MILLGSKKIDDKAYGKNDSNGTVNLGSVGLPENFYGGMAKRLGKFQRTNARSAYLCLDAEGEVMDILIEDPSKMTLVDLQELLTRRKIPFEENALKPELVAKAIERLSIPKAAE